eukprot:994194-Amorphochlora_amoeboformis.AAC.1
MGYSDRRDPCQGYEDPPDGIGGAFPSEFRLFDIDMGTYPSIPAAWDTFWREWVTPSDISPPLGTREPPFRPKKCNLEKKNSSDDILIYHISHIKKWASDAFGRNHKKQKHESPGIPGESGVIRECRGCARLVNDKRRSFATPLHAFGSEKSPRQCPQPFIALLRQVVRNFHRISGEHPSKPALGSDPPPTGSTHSLPEGQRTSIQTRFSNDERMWMCFLPLIRARGIFPANLEFPCRVHILRCPTAKP